MEALELREAEADDMVLPEQIKEINLKIAKVLNNIGCVNFENARFEEAKEAFVDAIAMQKKSLGDVSAFSFNNPATKPGFLTMASTMCNKGYIELEKEEYKPAIYTFNESLKIQKMLLGADNKLVLSTLDNLGFAYAMNRSYDRALAVSAPLSECFFLFS
jgi:tetratricopeptide (TPR) repeat protein